ncbi:MAG TPA: hypothetical protein VF271_02665 [Rhodanobacteraceae bacterium]
MTDTLTQQEAYLAQLLEAIQRSAWFLAQAQTRVAWPLDGPTLHARAKDIDLFGTLAAVNERFAKLQDSLAAAMRHTALLLGESPSHFLQVLALFEKFQVIDSARTWQQIRLLRNHAAHDYDLDYATIAEHFNTLHQHTPFLITAAKRLLDLARTQLHVKPATGQFDAEFSQLG